MRAKKGGEKFFYGQVKLRFEADTHGMRPLMKMSDFTFRFIFERKNLEGINYKVVKGGGGLFYTNGG